MPPKTVEIRDALTAVLTATRTPGLPVKDIQRQASPYASTYPLEELRVALSGGSVLDVMFKDLSPSSLSEAARRAKPDFLFNPRREIETYRHLLADNCLGTAGCYGSLVDPNSDRYWLFLERVPGEELYKIGDFCVWKRVAAWLAGMHRNYADRRRSNSLQLSSQWLEFNADHYRHWMRRALQSTAENQRRLRQLAERYETVINRLAALPTTILHGEFYPSNILIESNRSGLRICPIDWEMTAIGPALVDLAALVSGNWSEAQRTELALAYYRSSETMMTHTFATEEAFLAALDDCRLHVAIQWLGWSSDWTPPAAHARNWLDDALQLAYKIGCLSTN